MWLSKKMARGAREEDAATLGTVSIGGHDAAVITDGEKRNAKLITPGGYCWQPDAADNVLVIKGNELYVPGVLSEDVRAVKPGEILIFSKGASILLENSGSIRISGRVRIEGELLVNGKKVVTEE